MSADDDILEQIRLRPAMYTGESTLSSIFLFLTGYSFALDRHNVPADNDPLLLAPEFHDWVAYSLHYHESTSGWCNMICGRTSTDQEAIDLFIQLLGEFRKRIPNTVAKLKGYKKTYQLSTSQRNAKGDAFQSPWLTRNYPDSISLVTYTSDPGFFAYSDTDESFPSEGFHPDLESFELYTGADRSMLTIVDNNWHPKPYPDA